MCVFLDKSRHWTKLTGAVFVDFVQLVTLIDFHVARARPAGFVRPRCPLYAFVREQLTAGGGGGVRKLTVCGGGADRQRVVYTSTTHRVELGIAPNDDITSTGPYFVFKYEGQTVTPYSNAVFSPPDPTWKKAVSSRRVGRCELSR